jgi:hypothetical protein
MGEEVSISINLVTVVSAMFGAIFLAVLHDVWGGLGRLEEGVLVLFRHFGLTSCLIL